MNFVFRNSKGTAERSIDDIDDVHLDASGWVHLSRGDQTIAVVVFRDERWHEIDLETDEESERVAYSISGHE